MVVAARGDGPGHVVVHHCAEGGAEVHRGKLFQNPGQCHFPRATTAESWWHQQRGETGARHGGERLGGEATFPQGHGPGDILEAWKWRLVEREAGLVVVEAHLPEQLKNPQGQLFGGFTTSYVDFVSLHTYFEPILGPTFTIRGELVNKRGLTSLVSTKFFNDGTMLAHGLTTMRQVPQPS